MGSALESLFWQIMIKAPIHSGEMGAQNPIFI